MKTAACGLAILLALSTPLSALAQRQGGSAHGGGAPGGAGARGGGGSPHGGSPHGGSLHGGSPHGGGPPAAAAQRTGTPHAAPGGFNLDRDINASAHPPAPPRNNASHPPAPSRNAPPDNRPHRIVDNPAHRGQGAWAWNRGVVWAPAPAYWGGGFWGPFAFGVGAAVAGALVYGSFVDPATNEVLPSYEVAPGSTGAALLANYQLTQTPCGPPDLVVIIGPDSSVICAQPNGLVGPGEYDIDPSNLTLISQ